MTKLVPKLRFKEFSGEWEKNRLGDIYKFFPTKSFSRDKLNYEKGEVKNIHYGDIHTKFSTLFDITKEIVPYINLSVDITKIQKEYYCLEGDMIFADASEDLDDIGKSIELINLNNEKLLAGLHTLLARQKEKKIIKGFAGYLFKSNFIRNQIKREAQGAKVLGLSVRKLENITISFPKSPQEQQKIANCLSSLDNLIEVQSKKVEALKKHKKGLMQQLFPQEGEKEPKLRFKEFSGEWEEKKLGKEKNITVTIGEFVIKTKQHPDAKYPVYNGGKSYTGFYDEFNNDENKVVISARGANAGYVNIVKEKYWAGNSCYSIGLITENKFNFEFLYFYIKANENRFRNNQQAANIPSISKKDIENFNIVYPQLKEQQKIASCLSSLDNLIEAQSKKLEALKKHRKGLMQQMFVSEEE